MATLTRRDRLVDIAALLLIAGGVALYLWSAGRFNEIARLSYAHPGPPGSSALAAADRARYASYAGLGLVVAGLATGAAGAVIHRRAGRAVS
jgi:hypothetical protein